MVASDSIILDDGETLYFFLNTSVLQNRDRLNLNLIRQVVAGDTVNLNLLVLSKLATADMRKKLQLRLELGFTAMIVLHNFKC